MNVAVYSLSLLSEDPRFKTRKGSPGAGFLRKLPGLLPILIPPIAPHSLLIPLSDTTWLDSDSVVKQPA
jgi:hypothetical protein